MGRKPPTGLGRSIIVMLCTCSGMREEIYMILNISRRVQGESSESQEKCLMWKPSVLTAALVL
eukprot:5222337-Pyramimonas_sp.AAC.1